MKAEGALRITGRTTDGEVIEYGDPEKNYFRKMYCMREAILYGEQLPCVAETALPHLKCIWELAHLFEETPVFRAEFAAYDKTNDQHYCPCLVEDLKRCWHEGKLPGELNMPWSKGAKTWNREEI